MGMKNIYKNSDLNVSQLEQMVDLNDECRKIINDASQKLSLTARSYHRVLKVARTIADLEYSVNVNKDHILEALSYRKKRVS